MSAATTFGTLTLRQLCIAFAAAPSDLAVVTEVVVVVALRPSACGRAVLETYGEVGKQRS